MFAVNEIFQKFFPESNHVQFLSTMAPPSADVDTVSASVAEVKLDNPLKKQIATTRLIREPLKYSGSLDNYESFDVTNVIGREFPKLQLSEILNDDAKIRDLAILGENQHQNTFDYRSSLTKSQSPSVELSSSVTRTSQSRTRRF